MTELSKICYSIVADEGTGRLVSASNSTPLLPQTDVKVSPMKSSPQSSAIYHPKIGLSGAEVQWLEERCILAAFGALPNKPCNSA